MAHNAEAIRGRLLKVPQIEPVRRAIEFLERDDLISLDLKGGNTVEAFLQVYGTRLRLLPLTKLQQVGLEELVDTLSKLPPSSHLEMSGFENAEWSAFFWTTASGDMVGSVLVKRRSPEEERERQEWFDQNLKGGNPTP